MDVNSFVDYSQQVFGERKRHLEGSSTFDSGRMSERQVGDVRRGGNERPVFYRMIWNSVRCQGVHVTLLHMWSTSMLLTDDATGI